MNKIVSMTLFKFNEIMLDTQKLVDTIDSLICNNDLEYILVDTMLDLDYIYHQIIFDLKNKHPNIKIIQVQEIENVTCAGKFNIKSSIKPEFDGLVELGFCCNNKNNHYYFVKNDLIDLSTYCIFYGKDFIFSPTFTYAMQRNKNIIII